MYNFVVSFLSLVTRIFGLLKVSGKENIPKDQNFVVTCSHRGWVDVIMLAVSLYPAKIHYMAKKELFESKLGGAFLKSLNAFPVNRENPGPSAIKIPIKLLRENKIVGIFPSGTRTSEEVPLKRGAVTIAIKGKVPVLPASYHGPTNFKDIFKGQKAKIVFGKPLTFVKEQEIMNRNELLEYALSQLEMNMRKLDQVNH